ncbi:MAG TPA: 16S rRNA (guanine(966)-N(2))-methyltransferase RsmD [Thermoleophilaceae bacterium]|nr:16S rRNA (guanine(966)-N(2))-methyltransferase RsmD [Thermoleophilaceae bacterium]
MRIVAGEFRGRTIRAPAGRSTRPTADRVREALFSILGPLDGERVLDLFAGSGALGIEALSRGAASAVFVDSDPRAVEAVRRNLESLGSAATVHRRDALAYLRSARERPFDLVFLDPPYSSASELAGRLSELLPDVLSEGARIVSESDKRTPLELTLPLVDERVYGDTRIAIHRAA